MHKNVIINEKVVLTGKNIIDKYWVFVMFSDFLDHFKLKFCACAVNTHFKAGDCL